MTTTVNEIQNIARAIKECADLMKSLQSRCSEVAQANGAHSIDWANLPDAAKNPDGTILGLDFTGQEAANALGSQDEFRDFYAGQNVSQGNHGANQELLANPLAVRVQIIF